LYKKSKQIEIMKAIINLGKEFGTLNGVWTKNSEIKKIVNSKLKEGKAKLIIDNEETLMYEINE